MNRSILIVSLIFLLILVYIKYNQTRKEDFKDVCIPKSVKCRPWFSTKFYIHFIKNWNPVIKGKKLDLYLTEDQVIKNIFDNIKYIWKDAHINFDIVKIYHEDAKSNLSYFYPCDLNLNDQIRSIDFNLEHANPIYHKSIIKQSLESLINPYNLENDGFHIYIAPYIGKNSIAKTIFINKFPVTFLGLYSEDNEADPLCDQIRTNLDVYPVFKKNMDFSKVFAKHIGYLFGLKHLNQGGNLMNSNVNKNPLSDMEKSFNSGKIEDLKEIIYIKFNNLSIENKKFIFSEVVKLTSENNIYNKKDNEKYIENHKEFSNYSNSLKKKIGNLFNKNKDLAYKIGEYLGDLYSIHYKFNVMQFSNKVAQDSRVYKIKEFKRYKDYVKFKKEIVNIFKLISIPHLATIFSKIISYTELKLNDNQINKARKSAFKEKAILNNYYKTKTHYDVPIPVNKESYNNLDVFRDVIGEKVKKIDKLYKSECMQYMKTKENCEGPCFEYDMDCCSNKEYFDCMFSITRMRNKNYKMKKESQPLSNKDKKELEMLIKKEKLGPSCEKNKVLYMDTLNNSFI